MSPSLWVSGRTMEPLDSQCHVMPGSSSEPTFLVILIASLAMRLSLGLIAFSWSSKKGTGSCQGQLDQIISARLMQLICNTVIQVIPPYTPDWAYSIAEALCQGNRYLGSHLRILWHGMFSSQAVQVTVITHGWSLNWRSPGLTDMSPGQCNCLKWNCLQVSDASGISGDAG